MFAEGKPIVSFSWFVPAVLTFYLAFWVLMKLCKQRYTAMVLGGAVWFAVYMVACMGLRWGQWWYISAFPVVAGMAWAVHGGAVDTLLKACAATLFTLVVMLALHKVRFGNPVLRWLGQLSLEIYLMQGLAIMLLRSRWIYIKTPVLYGGLILVLTVVFAAVVHIAFKGISKKPTR